MKKIISLLGFIFIIILVIKFVWMMIPILLIGGALFFLYYKFLNPYLINKKNKTSTDEVYKEDLDKNQNTSFSGPVIDVDYEEVDKK